MPTLLNYNFYELNFINPRMKNHKMWKFNPDYDLIDKESERSYFDHCLSLSCNKFHKDGKNTEILSPKFHNCI